MRILVEGGHGFNQHAFTDLTDKPMATIQAQRPVSIKLAPGRAAQKSAKPPYQIPSMREIAKRRGSNGFSVASTFSGCGGSCLGFEMEGFSVDYAVEFLPHAQRIYRRNHPETFLDGRSIREIQPEEILERLGKARGELDVLEGSPPCDSFSTAGKRAKGWGKEKAYYGGKTAQRTDDLFFEFIRLLEGLKPRAFVAENVPGLIKGVAKGYFLEILAALKAAGYEVRAKVLDAQWLGVPQQRKRLILVGIRSDYRRRPRLPSPLAYYYSLGEVLGARSSADGDMRGTAIGKEWAGLGRGGQSERYFQLVRPDPRKPSPAITAAGGGRSTASVTHPDSPRKFSIPELKRICGFPDDFELSGSFAEQWAVLGMSVPPPMMAAVARCLREQLQEIDGA